MTESTHYNIVNPGSAIGAAIGATMEFALHELLKRVADEYGCHYLGAGIRKTGAARTSKKLVLFDNFGNEYNLDGVIADEAMRPLILLESKYGLNTKHDRYKGRWVCHAHTAIRRRYHSIRSSIAILAGNWSQSSQAMMESHDIALYLIPFDLICNLLDAYGIDFRWDEKEKEKAFDAWIAYSQLSAEQQAQIGRDMIATVADRLTTRIASILDDSVTREVERVVIELVSNLGEVKIFEFDSVAAAIAFLE
jgi:hypothetical protein